MAQAMKERHPMSDEIITAPAEELAEAPAEPELVDFDPEDDEAD